MVRKRPQPAPSALQADLAHRILRALSQRGAAPGERLIELELCREFAVSRTPVRGALRLLARQGAVTVRPGRGFVLAAPVAEPAGRDPLRAEDEEAARLFAAIARARDNGQLPDRFPQQEVVRRFGARLAVVVRVLRRLAELGLVERRPGNGWAFGPRADAVRALNESYAFRRALEPQMLLQPGFRLDRAWAEKSRAAHLAFRSRPWQDSDAADFYDVNADFHEQLARCCANRYMLKSVQRQIQLRRFLSHQWDYSRARVHSAIADHLEILAALESGYADKAAALMLHHLTTSAFKHEDEANAPD